MIRLSVALLEADTACVVPLLISLVCFERFVCGDLHLICKGMSNKLLVVVVEVVYLLAMEETRLFIMVRNWFRIRQMA